jgi:DNA-binding transcriptional LysR family regulator
VADHDAPSNLDTAAPAVSTGSDGVGRLPAVDDLALLVAVAEAGGVGAGARVMGMAQPNASRALRRLERRFGVRLLRRGARGSSLTSEGALVVDWSRAVLEANERLVAGVAALTGPATPSIAVSASMTIAEDLLPRWLAGLRAESPDVRVALTVCNSETVGTRLSTGRDVLGFIESTSLPATLTGPVEHVTVARDRLVVVTAADHPWARRTRPISLAELGATALVVREPGSGTRVSLERALPKGFLSPPAVELGSNAAVRVAVAAGVGPAVLSEHAVASAVHSGELRAVHVDGLVVERPLRAVWLSAAQLPEPARRLVDLALSIEAERDQAPPDIDPGWGL